MPNPVLIVCGACLNNGNTAVAFALGKRIITVIAIDIPQVIAQGVLVDFGFLHAENVRLVIVKDVQGILALDCAQSVNIPGYQAKFLHYNELSLCI